MFCGHFSARTTSWFLPHLRILIHASLYQSSIGVWSRVSSCSFQTTTKWKGMLGFYYSPLEKECENIVYSAAPTLAMVNETEISFFVCNVNPNVFFVNVYKCNWLKILTSGENITRWFAKCWFGYLSGWYFTDQNVK